jgi:hypothetical protein
MPRPGAVVDHAGRYEEGAQASGDAMASCHGGSRSSFSDSQFGYEREAPRHKAVACAPESAIVREVQVLSRQTLSGL